MGTPKRPINRVTQYILRNATITSFGNGLGMISGFVADALVLCYFGLSGNTDALFAAFALPRLISTMVETQTPRVMVPVFSKSPRGIKSEDSIRIECNLINTTAVFLLLVSIMVSLLAPILIPIQVPGMDYNSRMLSIQLCALLSFLVFFQGLGGILRSVLYANHIYFVPSLTKFVINSVVILFLLFFRDILSIFAVPFGFLIGGFLQVVVLILALWLDGFTYVIIIKPFDPQLRKVFKLHFYPFLDYGLSQSRVLVENFLISFLPSGNLTALRYANRIIFSATGFLVGGVTTAVLPLLSQVSVSNDSAKIKDALLRGIKLLFSIAMPLCAFLVLGSKPFLQLVFTHGQLSNQDINLVSLLIASLSPYVILSRLVGIAQLPFYACLDTKTPMIGTIISFVTWIAWTGILFQVVGIFAFPISLCLSSFLTSLLMFYLLHKRFGSLPLRPFTTFILKLLLATMALCLFFGLGSMLIPSFQNQTMLEKAFSLLLPTVLSTLAYLFTCHVLGLLDVSTPFRRRRLAE